LQPVIRWINHSEPIEQAPDRSESPDRSIEQALVDIRQSNSPDRSLEQALVDIRHSNSPDRLIEPIKQTPIDKAERLA
jgi:hypothetical protein